MQLPSPDGWRRELDPCRHAHRHRHRRHKVRIDRVSCIDEVERRSKAKTRNCDLMEPSQSLHGTHSRVELKRAQEQRNARASIRPHHEHPREETRAEGSVLSIWMIEHRRKQLHHCSNRYMSVLDFLSHRSEHRELTEGGAKTGRHTSLHDQRAADGDNHPRTCNPHKQLARHDGNDDDDDDDGVVMHVIGSGRCTRRS